jgi:hypothetical protein
MATIVDRDGELDLEVTVKPKDRDTAIGFAFPGTAQPLRSNLAGARVASGAWWVARFVAPPAEGVVLRATFRAADRDGVLDGSIVLETAALPGGEGWQKLPTWLPQQYAVWDGVASYIVPLPAVLGAPTETPK